MLRTHTCGELTLQNVDEPVILQGWVKRVRKMGSLNFVDLRDFYGITQLVLKDESIKEIKPEYVLEVQGTVQKRVVVNSKLQTGEIEVVVSKTKIINKSKIPPFEITDDVNATEETRLKYRYLDLRRPKLQANLKDRAKMNVTIRNFLNSARFLEVETPTLIRTTPEGSRNFIVPSRLNKPKFYALPQSPQLMKQLLMVGGIDRYYQIARCYRDEDFRADRQPEFTQLDLEMSFATGEDIIYLTEKLLQQIFKELKNLDVTLPFKRLTYSEAIRNYGSDKPDLRFDLKIQDLETVFANTAVKLFLDVQEKGWAIRGLAVDHLLTKTQIKELEETAKQNHLQGLAVLKVNNEGWSGTVAAQLSATEKAALLERFQLQESGTIFLFKAEYEIISKALGAVRQQLGQMLALANPDQYEFVWIVDFPLFEWSADENRFVSAHHPFTMPKNESLKEFDQNPATALADAYDIVLNGSEIGGGSQRISDCELQKRVFAVLNLKEQEIQESFGWFVNAYNYGAPYHSGLALGIDRLAMILGKTESIRDVIAFPKNASGVDMMMDAPNDIDVQQLKDLDIKIS